MNSSLFRFLGRLKFQENLLLRDWGAWTAQCYYKKCHSNVILGFSIVRSCTEVRCLFKPLKRQNKHRRPLEGRALSSDLWFGSGVGLQSMWCCFVRGNGLYLHEQIPLKPELLCGFGGWRCLVWPCYRKLHGAFTAGLWPHCMYMLLCAAFQRICIEHLCTRTEPYAVLVTVR